MKGLFKKVAAVALCLCLAGPLCACDPGDGIDSSKVTVLSVVAGGGGTGTAWMEEAQARFEKYTEENNISYAEGKTGVRFRKLQTSNSSGDELKNWNSSGLVIYGVDRQRTIDDEVRTGSIVSIDDMMRETDPEKNYGESKSVDSKIHDQVKTWYQDSNGEYYGIPYLENYAGLSYNREVFDLYGFYFADSTTGAREFTSEKFGKTVHFVRQRQSDNKSCGPDGKKGTNDDGLPTSVVEFLCLCEFMKEAGISPINLTGKYPYYVNFFQDGLLPSLIGYDRYKSIIYENDSQGQEVEVVVGFDKSKKLFPGISYIDAPITEKVVITPGCGYYGTWMVEKYYVDALLTIIEKENFFHSDFNAAKTHLNAQKSLINGTTEKVGMLIEASYWNYESVLRGQYKLSHKDPYDVDIRWMPFPVTLDTTVVNTTDTLENGRTAAQPPLLYEYNSSYLVISAKYKNNPEILNAARDFLRFLMTDAELSHWTVSNFSFKPMNYEITEEDQEKMLPFYENIYSLRRDDGAKVLHNWADNEIFRNNMRTLYDRGWGSGQFSIDGDTNMLRPMINPSNKYSAMTCFVMQMYTAGNWGDIAKGVPITDYNGVVSTLK